MSNIEQLSSFAVALLSGLIIAARALPDKAMTYLPPKLASFLQFLTTSFGETLFIALIFTILSLRYFKNVKLVAMVFGVSFVMIWIGIKTLGG